MTKNVTYRKLLYTIDIAVKLVLFIVNLHVYLCSIIEQLGGKQRVMHLLSHDDPNVRYEALLAVQKLMVHNWYVCLLCNVEVVQNKL